VPYDEKWAEQENSLNRRIQKVEHFLESLSPFQEYVRIVEFETRPKLFKILDHDVFIGSTLLRQEGSLEKAIMKVWYREQTNAFVRDNPLLEESLTDFLLFTMSGEGIDADLTSAKWPFVVRNLRNYCQSRWRQLEHFHLCGEMDSSTKDSSAFISSSVRPLLSQSLISAYLKLPLRERKDVLDGIAGFLRTMNLVESGIGLTSTLESRQSLVDVTAEVSAFVRTVGAYLASNDNSISHWLELMKQDLADRGFTEEPLNAQTDLLIVLRNIDGEKFFPEGRLKMPLDGTAIAYDDKLLYFLPQTDGLDRRLLGRVFAQRLVYIHCGPLTVSELTPFFERSTNLLAVQMCDSNKGEILNLDSYINGGVEKFARKNPKLEFLDIHLPSLAMALKLRRVTISENLRLAGTEHSILRKQLGWQKSEFDSKTKIYHVESDIEAIRIFR
jgi:hypothetical protein